MQVGLFGKLPSHGDFLRRRTSDQFVEVWDGWLQECVAATRERFGERWLDLYLTSPIWRFVCAPGVCGADAAIGIMAPSVDRVGRYFPLTVVAQLPAKTNVVSTAAAAAAFFQSAEQLVIETLEAEPVDFEAFDARVNSLRAQLPLPDAAPALGPAAGAMLDASAAIGWQVPMGSPADLSSLFVQLLSERLAAAHNPVVLWWTEGSDKVEPSLLVSKGLPNPESFGAFLDGSWKDHRWQSAGAAVQARPVVADFTPSLAGYRFVSGAASDVGCVRTVNQDAYVERSAAGIWAVADGLGGHKEGDVASRMVCDSLADFEPAPNFDDTVSAVAARLQAVNAWLLRTSARSLLADRCGSTVVVLLARNREFAILWAGDSRAYRLRNGRLQQLTKDHSASMAGAGFKQSNIVTRAIGVAANLDIDVYRDTLNAGDRFLLCSDGLTRTVSDFQIQALLENKDSAAAVQGLVKASLDAGAPDNVTAVVVEIQNDTDASGRGSSPLAPSTS